MKEKGKNEYNAEDPTHSLAGKVLDFVCGIKAPPAPAIGTYMESDLAKTMQKFQDPMASEVRHAGMTDVDSTKLLKDPEMATFWEMSKFFPSSENSELRVIVIQALVVCRTTKTAAIVTMNIYVHEGCTSGFTLDHVMSVDDSSHVEMEYFKKAEERHTARINRAPDEFNEQMEDDDDAIAAMIQASQNKSGTITAPSTTILSDGSDEVLSTEEQLRRIQAEDSEE